MSRLLSLFFTLPLGLALSSLLLIYASLEAVPLVHPRSQPSHTDIGELNRSLFEQNPGELLPGEPAGLSLTERNLDLALSRALAQVAGVSSRFSLHPQQLLGELTWNLPLSDRSPYLNVSFDMREKSGETVLATLKIGQVDLSLNLDSRVLADLIGKLLMRQEPRLLHAKVERVHIQEDLITLVYEWDSTLMQNTRDLLFTDDHRELAQIYLDSLQKQLDTKPERLPQLLAPLFHMASERSVNSDPIMENRALFTALGFYALGFPSSAMQGVGLAADPSQPRQVSLRGRTDLSRHYLVSAAIAAGNDSGLANAVGLYKEWSDSRDGSGFSFVDLAADRAGTRLGELATRSKSMAVRIQELLRSNPDDASLLPAFSDLPEGLSDAQLNAAFGGIHGEAYQRMTRNIERRLDGMPLYRLR